MKKIIILTLVSLVLGSIGAKSFSMQTPNVEEQKTINQGTVTKFKNFKNDDILNWLEKFNTLGNKYIENIRTCEKAHFNEELDFFGFKISLRADIFGWKNNKCSYEFTGNIGGVGKDIRDVFSVPISDSSFEKFKPVVQCEFEKKDLDLMAKVLKDKQKQNFEMYKKMLENDNFDFENLKSKDKKLSENEQLLVKTFTDGKTCKIPNMNELMINFLEVQKEISK